MVSIFDVYFPAGCWPGSVFFWVSWFEVCSIDKGMKGGY
jgi:hypothetical protein